MGKAGGGRAVFIATTIAAGALSATLAFPAHAGENKTTKWQEDGFACILNQDGTSDCRFDVDAKNKLGHADWFRCWVNVDFTTTTWKGKTAAKRIQAGEWKGFNAGAEKVPEGEIVQSVKWRCRQIDGL
jgi:hypothetical protein